MQIPRIIYYSWVSDKPMPEKYQAYINSWKKFMSEYEIRQISLENISHNKFTDHYLSRGDYVTAGHFDRCLKLYETGGLYFDTDVMAIKSFDDLLNEECFVGCEGDGYCNNAVMGCVAGSPFMLEYMQWLLNFDFNTPQPQNETGPRMITKILKTYGWDGGDKTVQLDGVKVFNSKFFYPFHYTTNYTPECVTQETHCVHDWAASWQ